MKKIINGKVYDTETAVSLGSFYAGYSGDLNHREEELFRTPKGAYFIDGGGHSYWSGRDIWKDENDNGEAYERWGVIAVTEEEALSWMERHGETEVIEEYFSHLLEEA
jgi:hypothetical protein